MSAMCPERRLRGFAIVSAVFLLVVLAALGVFMMNFSTVQHTTSAMDVQGSRAYQAARAGVEWGVYQALRNNSCAASTPLTLSGFTVTVTCSKQDHTEAGSPVTTYHLVSSASQGTVGTIGFVERQVRVMVAK